MLLVKKKKLEVKFTEHISIDPILKKKYAHVLPRLKQLYAEVQDQQLLQMYNSEIFARNTEMTFVATLFHN